MRGLNKELQEIFENHKNKIDKNIKSAKESGLNKVTAILLNNEELQEVHRALIEWLFDEGYMVSIKKEEFKILTIQW